MTEQKWHKVAAEEDLKQGVPVAVAVGEKPVLVVRLGDRVYACGNTCTHYGAPMSDGLLIGKVATCPWHNARFDVTSGALLSPPALNDLPRYPVKIENGDVYVGEAIPPEASPVTATGTKTFVILGAGAAGGAAAETLRREGFTGRLVVVTAESAGPYDRPNLSKDYLAGTAAPEWIPLRGQGFYDEQKIELITGRRATAVDTAAHTITFADGDAVTYDRLLIATGGTPRPLGIPGRELAGVHLLRSLEDCEAIVASLAGAQRAVVLGAGFIGLEVAASLRKRELAVLVVDPLTVPMLRVFGERIGARLKRLHEENGVTFRLETTARELTGSGRVEAVVLADGSRIEADLVVAGLGVVPAVAFLEGTGLVRDGAVPVDACLRTEAADVFAAGDIAAVADPRTGEPRRVEHWAEAQRQGQHAARAMLGSEDPYGEVPFFWTKQYRSGFQYVGHAPRYDRIAYRGDVENGAFVAGYFEEGTLKAAAGHGRSTDIILLGEILKAGHPIPFEQFEDESFDFAVVL